MFQGMKIKNELEISLNKMGINELKPIQKLCIPHLLEKKDMMAAAKTGSGKTLAFLIPLVNKLMNENCNKDNGTVAIIISPVRDLSLQIYEVLVELISGTEISAGMIFGGSKKSIEVKYLKHGVNIIVATPGRLLDHMNNTSEFNYSNVNTLVIDEADQLMKQGFLLDMRSIISKLPVSRQTMLFSATLNINDAKLKKIGKSIKINDESTCEEKVMKLAYYSLKHDCVQIDLSKKSTNQNEADIAPSLTNSKLCQFYIKPEPEDKFRALYTFVKNQVKKKKIIVFMATNLSVRYYLDIFQLLSDTDIVFGLFGKQKNSKRHDNLDKFKNCNNGLLICTDVAARGIDIPNVNWVVQYDPPSDIAEYVHRVGRTARADNAGKSMLFIRKHEMKFLDFLKKDNIKMTEKIINSGELADIQKDYVKFVKNNSFTDIAVKAFKSVVDSYRSNKSFCFDVYKLDLEALSKTFGLDFIPYINIPEKPNLKRHNEDESQNNESLKISKFK